MNRTATISLALVALAAVPGCWSDEEAISGAVWADDDVEQAYLELYWEQRTLEIGTVNSRNFEHRVMVQAPDGSDRRALTPVREGNTGSDFYFMRQEGYVLLDVTRGSVVHWQVLRLSDGAAHDVFTHDFYSTGTCPTYEVLPSPDGRTLAVFHGELGVDVGPDDAPPVPGTAGSCAGGALSVDLVDPHTAAYQARFTIEVTGMPQRMWTRDGVLHVWDDAGDAWVVDPVSGPQTAPVPTCTWPRTSSSGLSDAGVLVEPGTPDDPVVVVSRPVDDCW